MHHSLYQTSTAPGFVEQTSRVDMLGSVRRETSQTAGAESSLRQASRLTTLFDIATAPIERFSGTGDAGFFDVLGVKAAADGTYGRRGNDGAEQW